MHFIANNINIIAKPNNIFDVTLSVTARWNKLPNKSVSIQPNIAKHNTTEKISIKLENSAKAILSNVFIFNHIPLQIYLLLTL